jgi:hypothetical protein
MKELRVAFCGASGTGKSTLANWVAKEYSLVTNPIGARSVAAAMGYASPYDVDKENKRAEFQRRLLDEKVAWEREHESFVVDRTPIDNLVYTMLHDVSSITSEILEKVALGFSRYTHIFFCPIEAFFNLAGDPSRLETRAYHVVYEAALTGWIDRLVPPTVFRVSDDNLDARKASVKMILDGVQG